MYGKHYMMNHIVTNLTLNKTITYAGKPLPTYHTLEFHCSLGLSSDSLWYIMMSSLFNVNIDPNSLMQMLHFPSWSYVTTQIGPLHHTHTTSWHCTPPCSPHLPCSIHSRLSWQMHKACLEHASSILGECREAPKECSSSANEAKTLWPAVNVWCHGSNHIARLSSSDVRHQESIVTINAWLPHTLTHSYTLPLMHLTTGTHPTTGKVYA